MGGDRRVCPFPRQMAREPVGRGRCPSPVHAGRDAEFWEHPCAAAAKPRGCGFAPPPKADGSGGTGRPGAGAQVSGALPSCDAVLLLAWVRWGPGAFSIWATSCLQSTGSTATCPVRASRHDETYRGAGPQNWLLLTPGASGSSVASAGCSLTRRGFLSGAPHGPVTSVFRVTRTDLGHLSGDGYSVTPAAPGDTPGSPWRNDVVSLGTYERVKRVLLATLPSLFFFR